MWPEEEELTKITKKTCIQQLKIKFYDVSQSENTIGKYFCEIILPFLRDYYSRTVVGVGGKEKKKKGLVDKMLKVVGDAQKRSVGLIEWGDVFLCIYRYRSKYITRTEFSDLLGLFRTKDNFPPLSRAVTYLFKNKIDPCNALIGVRSSSTLPSQCILLSKILGSNERKNEVHEMEALLFDIHTLPSCHNQDLFARANDLLDALSSPPSSLPSPSEACPPYAVVLVREDTVEESYIFARFVASMGPTYAKVLLGTNFTSLRVVLSSRVLVIPQTILNDSMFLNYDKKLNTSSSSLLGTSSLAFSTSSSSSLDGISTGVCQYDISSLVEDPLEELNRNFDLLMEAHLQAVLQYQDVNVDLLLQLKEIKEEYLKKEAEEGLPKLYLNLAPRVGDCMKRVKCVIRLVRELDKEQEAGELGLRMSKMRLSLSQPAIISSSSSSSASSTLVPTSSSSPTPKKLSSEALEEIKTISSKCRSYVARWLQSERSSHPVIVNDQLAEEVLALADRPYKRILDSLNRTYKILGFLEKKITERLTVVVNGELKDEMTDWWTDYIEMRVDQYLASYGYDTDVPPAGLIIANQGSVPEARKNVEIIESLIDLDSPHVEQTRDFIVEVTDEVCVKVKELEEEMVNVVSLASEVPVEKIDDECLDRILGELEEGTMEMLHYIPNKAVEFVILDIKHIQKMQKMYDEWRAHSDIFASDAGNSLEVVPIHGIVFGGFKTREKNLRNYLEEMEMRG